MSNVQHRLLLIGAGGFGREVEGWISLDPSSVQLHEPWYFGGFLDANPDALKGFDIEHPILGDPTTFVPSKTDHFICGIGDPATKLRVCRYMKARGAHFVSVISSQAIVGPRCQLGQGCILVPGAKLTTDVTLGSFVTINVVSGAGHDVIMGDGCTLSAHCDVTGGVTLGEGVFLGSHATIAPGVKVGNYARIGAGSAVIRNVPPDTTVMGVPAKIILTRAPQTKE